MQKIFRHRMFLLWFVSCAIAASIYAYSLRLENVNESLLPEVGTQQNSATGTKLPVDWAVGVPTAPPMNSVGIPLDQWTERHTKKILGTKVSPKNSPVSPEKFTGYHAGADFETFPSEKDTEIPVRAICAGKLVLKKRATGYGGVAVQRCRIDNQEVTVVYGHLKLESISAKTDSTLEMGQTIGLLGKGFSTETDGERKHLHLSIHIGTMVDIRGYVATSGELKQWLDPLRYLEEISKK